jgi:tetratricopeptide (TPR) repeat protein
VVSEDTIEDLVRSKLNHHAAKAGGVDESISSFLHPFSLTDQSDRRDLSVFLSINRFVTLLRLTAVALSRLWKPIIQPKFMSTRSIVLGGIGVVLLAAIMSFAGMQGRPKGHSTVIPTPTNQPLNVRTTPADRQIQKAEARIKSNPSSAEAYSLLAAAYMQKSRETGDFSFNTRAEAALTRSLEINPNDSGVLTLRATLLLTYHRFREALAEAKRLEATNGPNADVYGVMTDALVELGDYQEAIKTAQKMINLRPDSASYSRVSYLRALHGDLEGAIEAMRIAVKAADPNNPESAGWYRVHLGLELMNSGKRQEGEREVDVALRVFPDYHLALNAKGRARVAAGDFQGAIEFYKRSQERVPLPDTVIALGDLYTKLGRAEEAKKQYQLGQFIESAGASASTYSRQLALFWADHDMKLDQALEIMRRERSVRADIYTSDALAWCLFKKGQAQEARNEIDSALRLGTRDAAILYHAGMIYSSLDDRRCGAKYLQQALAINPSFNVLQAEVAHQTLDTLRQYGI